MDRYVIKADGSLWIEPSAFARKQDKDFTERAIAYTGDMVFYTDTPLGWAEYRAYFFYGQLEKPIERTDDHYKVSGKPFRFYEPK